MYLVRSCYRLAIARPLPDAAQKKRGRMHHRVAGTFRRGCSAGTWGPRRLGTWVPAVHGRQENRAVVLDEDEEAVTAASPYGRTPYAEASPAPGTIDSSTADHT